MENFKQNVVKRLDIVTRKHVNELCSVWIRLFGHDNEDVLSMQLEGHYTTFLKSIIQENQRTESKLKKRIEIVRDKIETIQGQLKEEITLPDLNDMPLHRFFKEATSTLVIFDKKLQQRWEELKILQEEGKALCKELNETPLELLKLPNNLPSEDEMQNLRNLLNLLRELKVGRSKIIAKYQLEIRKLLEIFDLNQQERLKLIGSGYGLEIVDQLRLLAFELQEERAKMVTDAEDIFVRLQSLWEELSVSEDHQKLFSYDLNSCNKAIYDKLKSELERCENMKLEKIPELIENLRMEIVDFSQKCMKGEEFRSRSTTFEASVYDENILSRHQVELRQLKEFFNTNHETFKLISRRDELKLQIEEMNRNQTYSKARLNNRGGHLLKEEQGRKALEREILQTEIALCKAVDDYQAKNNAPLTVFDNAIQLDRTAKARMCLKNQRSLKNLQLKKPFSDRTNLN